VGACGECTSKKFLPLLGGGEEGDGVHDPRITNDDSAPHPHPDPALKEKTFIG
jgi:hypothetical protein